MPENSLCVGNLAAAPGAKIFGYEEVLIAGAPIRFGVFLVNGSMPGPTLVVTAGVHAAEYASIAAALELGRSLQPKDLRGRVIIVPVVNVPGFGVRAIYVCPLDGKNPNRCFPGKALGTASERIAYWLFNNVMLQGNYYVDLHGGDLVEALVPFSLYHRTGNAEVDRVSLEMAQVFGIPYIVRSETPGSTYAAASAAGIPGILPESGGQGIWRPGDVAYHTNGLNRLMRHLGMLEGPLPEPISTTHLDRFVWLRSDQEGFWYPGVQVGDDVQEGQTVGRVMDCEGRALQSAVAPTTGRVLFLVTSLAINKGDPLLAIGA
jgi:predicted deacylase